MSASENKAACARIQPCGCVVCTCDEEDRCSGCGAHPCDSGECVFDDPSRIVWDRHPLLDQLADAQAENEQLRKRIERAQRRLDADPIRQPDYLALSADLRGEVGRVNGEPQYDSAALAVGKG